MNAKIVHPQEPIDRSILDRTLEDVLKVVRRHLKAFASNSDFIPKMQLVFGSDFDIRQALSWAENWAGDDFSIIPEIEICPKVEIDRANGAFASTTNKIYLAREFLSENADNLKAINSTLLEEIGHSLDWRLNAEDTPGDEGEIFSAVVRGEVLLPGQLQQLKTEDDTATITL